MFQSLIVGEVIDNEDPMQQGRCKIEVPSFTKGLEPDIIPWSHQLFPVGTGTDVGIPTFKIPAVGTKVVVIFPEKDIYSSFYLGELMYQDHQLEELLQDYPETYGFIDKIKNKYWINMKKKTVDVHHHTGTHLHIDKQGTITLDGVKDLNINIKGNTNVTVKGNATIDVGGDTSVKTGGNTVIETGGTMDLKSGGPMKLTAPKIDLN